MQLNNLQSVIDNRFVNIRISDALIADITDCNQRSEYCKENLVLKFHNAIVFPGLINSHDHLELHCQPLSRSRAKDIG